MLLNKQSDAAKGLSPKLVKEFLQKQRDSNLADYYDELTGVTLAFDDTQSVVKFIKENTPFTMEFSDGEVLYNIPELNISGEVFDVSVENGFTVSNGWLYDKIIAVDLVYPNIEDASLSSEMTAFYICFITASVLGNVFLEEFEDAMERYDFNKWIQNSDVEPDFLTLSSEWIQAGNITVKMLAAAAKYALQRRMKKKKYYWPFRFARGAGFRI